MDMISFTPDLKVDFWIGIEEVERLKVFIGTRGKASSSYG
jgi:hypothetical protein